MAVRRTPPLLAKGKYQVNNPFVLDETLSYTCIALRKFDDIVREGEDVEAVYYTPFGLATTIYERDRDLGAVIVTLVSEFGEYVYLPDTYIDSFPDVNQPNYKHVVLSCSLGAIPYYIDLSALKQDISGVVSERLGILDAKVTEGIAATRQSLSITEADTIESARSAAISNLKTERARRLELEDQNAKLAAQVRKLSQLLIDNGVASPNT